MSTKNYLDYAGLKRVLKHLLPGARKIWHGTRDEWEALDEIERDKHDQAEIASFKKEGQVVTGTFTPSTLPGVTVTIHDNVDPAHSFWRIGNLLIVNYNCYLKGTFNVSGDPTWLPLFEFGEMLKPGETVEMVKVPLAVSKNTQWNNYDYDPSLVQRDRPKELASGRYIYAANGLAIDATLGFQMIFYIKQD